jgi:hypothetical protein
MVQHDTRAGGVTYRLTDLTEVAGVFCGCAEACRDAVRRTERQVDVRDDLPPDAAWSLVESIWRQQGRAAPYDRKTFIDLVSTSRLNDTGLLLHARDEQGQPVACALFVYDCNTAYYVLGAVIPDCGTAGVDLLLIWRGIRVLQQKTRAIDFGGPVGLLFGAREMPLAEIAEPKSNGAIFYKARALDTGNMWDTWAYYHQGTYYLYCLANSGDIGWDNISLATSPDGVRWTERGPVMRRRPTSIWMGTGSTWKSPHFSHDGKFLMNFSASEGGMTRQTIFFAESTDLVHWKRLGDEVEFRGGGRWYEPFGRWDCIFTLPRPAGGLYGYWTAQPRDGARRFGFGQSDDGVHWEALEAPDAEAPPDGEVGAVALLAGRYYMLYGTGGSYTMLTLVADRPEGPFRAASRNHRLLGGHTYFTRFFSAPDGDLVTHHTIARDGQVYGAPFKQAVVDAEGTLRLGWWRGNDALKRTVVPLVAPDRAGTRVAMIPSPFDVARGVVLEGSLVLPLTGAPGLTGLCLECANKETVAITVSSDATVQFGTIRQDGTDFLPEKQANREIAFGGTLTFRLLLEHSLLEFYLEDVLMECYSLPAAATGRIGFLGEAAATHAWYAR